MFLRLKIFFIFTKTIIAEKIQQRGLIHLFFFLFYRLYRFVIFVFFEVIFVRILIFLIQFRVTLSILFESVYFSKQKFSNFCTNSLANSVGVAVPQPAPADIGCTSNPNLILLKVFDVLFDPIMFRKSVIYKTFSRVFELVVVF